MRRISFQDEIQKRILIFLTNNLELSAETIYALYKACWEIGLFLDQVRLEETMGIQKEIETLCGMCPREGKKDPFPIGSSISSFAPGCLQNEAHEKAFYLAKVLLEEDNPDSLI